MQSLCCRMANKVVWKCKPMVTGETVFFVIIAYFVDMWCCHHVFVHQLLDNYHDLITTRVVTGLYRCHEIEVYAVAKRSQLIHMLVSVCIHRNHRVYICMFLFMMLTWGMLMSTEPFCFAQLFNFEFHIGIMWSIFSRGQCYCQQVVFLRSLFL